MDRLRRLSLALAAASSVVAAGRSAARAQPSATAPHDVAPDDDPAPDDASSPADVTTGALRAGIYQDSDRTTVWRGLANLARTIGRWSLNASLGVDSVTSASVDVRSSPLGMVDVVSSASGTSTSGGKMTDIRGQGTAAAGYNDGDGHQVTLTGAAAAERDYESLSGGANGSIDVVDRAITLLAGFSFTQNWIQSVVDRELFETMFSVGWTGGLGFVLTPSDVVRLRYDGSATDGYLASPYRNVRFGNWTTTTNAYDQILFENTIGSADGLPEKVPEDRISHAAVIEWVHALSDTVGVHPSVRLGRDSWGINSLTAAADLRLASPAWRLQLGYRFYMQSAASFYQSKYTMDPSTYEYYTSDKELGRERGHIATLDLARVLGTPQREGETRLLLDAQISVMSYSYPDFPLLDSRRGAFFDLGLTWER